MAATSLGLLRKKQQRLDDAERWLRTAAEGGDVMGATAFGMLAGERGRHEEAVEWLERGAARGDQLAVEVLAGMARGDG